MQAALRSEVIAREMGHEKMAVGGINSTHAEQAEGMQTSKNQG